MEEKLISIKNFNLGYDPKLFTSKLLSKYFINNNLISIDQNLIDQIFKFKENRYQIAICR